MDVWSLLQCLGLEEDEGTAAAMVRAVQHAEDKAFGEPPALGLINTKNETLIYLRPEASPPQVTKPRTPRMRTSRPQRGVVGKQPSAVASANAVTTEQPALDPSFVEKRFEQELPTWRRRLIEYKRPSHAPVDSSTWSNFPVVE